MKKCFSIRILPIICNILLEKGGKLLRLVAAGLSGNHRPFVKNNLRDWLFTIPLSHLMARPTPFPGMGRASVT
jgi:hypothetical protein